MPLTVTTDLVQITSADSLTGWTQIGGTDTADTDYFAQGLACISLTYNTGTERGSTFDIGAGNTLDFTTTHAGKLIYIWLRCAVPSLVGLRSAGAMKIIIGSGATVPGTATGDWKGFYVGGNDTLVGTDGWVCYIIDPTLTASQTVGTPNMAAARHFGATMTPTASVKGNPFGIDQIMYGFGTLRARGTNTTDGAGFKEMSDADFGTIGNRYGIMTEKEGIFYVQGRLELGDSVSTNPTTFTSYDEVLRWNYPTYYDGTREVPCMNKFRPDGTPYFGITVVGNSTTPAGDTIVTFGAKVGTGDTAKGRNGPTLIGSRQPTGFDGDDGNVETLLIYGTTFNGFRYGIDLSANSSTDDFIGNSIIGCGSVQSGPAENKGNTFINCLGGAHKVYEDFINARATTAEVLATADPSYLWGNATGGTQLSIPSASAGYLEILDPGASDVRNVAIIEADVVGSSDQYAEMVVNFPSAGANQSRMGPIIRKAATLATEDYWWLKVDIVAQTITLISCTAGVDTTQAGPTSVTINEDTPYLVHLRANASNVIEGFFNGTRITVTNSTHSTNTRVGIRAEAEADQTSTAPRILRFAAGPNTDILGALRLPVVASTDFKYGTFINNDRATSITDSTTRTYANMIFSNNMVDVRNTSGGATTINVTLGDSPVRVENVGASTSTSIVASVPVDITVVDKNDVGIVSAQVALYVGSTEVVNADTNGSGIVSTSYTAATPASAVYKIRKSSASATKYVATSGPATISANGLNLKVVLQEDPVNAS